MPTDYEQRVRNERDYEYDRWDRDLERFDCFEPYNAHEHRQSEAEPGDSVG